MTALQPIAGVERLDHVGGVDHCCVGFAATPKQGWPSRADAARGDVFDSETGRIAYATFGDYLIPANADVADLDLLFVRRPDTVRPIGIKGVGEIGVRRVSRHRRRRVPRHRPTHQSVADHQ
jgi:hypothetical protein